MIRTLNELSGEQWSCIWTITGGKEDCIHSYEEMDAISEDDYSAVYHCVHCNARLDYDVSDLGD